MKRRRKTTKYREEDIKNFLQEVEQEIVDLQNIKINLKEKIENDGSGRNSS